MDVRTGPGAVSGSVGSISSKSELHRLIICSALADRPTVIRFRGFSDDVDATLSCASALGACIERGEYGVTVRPGAPISGKPVFDCRESGSTLRFILPAATVRYKSACFRGDGRLAERPIEGLMSAMSANGVSFSADRLPFETQGTLRPGIYELPGNVSSQYISGLLMSLPLLGGPSTIVLKSRLESASYVDITLSVLERFGIEIVRRENIYYVPHNQTYRSPGEITADGDWSNAAFFLAAGALGNKITVTGLNMSSSQGDRAVLDIFRDFGAEIITEGENITVRGGHLHGCDVDMTNVPDLLPILAVTAAFAEGQTRFYGASRLRFKESDRLASAESMINGLGGSALQTDDGLIVRGGGLSGGTVSSFHDHRIAMAAAIASTRCMGSVDILDASAVSKSYPAFYEDFSALGGKVHVI